MSLNQARLAALCSFLMFLFALGTAWSWRRVAALDRASTAPPYHFTTAPLDHPTTTDHLTTAPLHHATTTSEFVEKKVELKQGLPTQFLLDVPFTSQAPEKNWDQPWQDACEEAAALMIDAYYKGYSLSPLFAKDELLKMIAWEEEKGWGVSIEMEKIKIIFEKYLGLVPKRTIRIVDNPTIEQMKRFVADGKPVYMMADGKVLPNPHYRNGGPVYHALVVKGYTETEFVTNDPGTQFGEGFRFKYNDLMNAIRDWNGGEVKNGRKVVLVIE